MRKKLIEVALPLDAINTASAREKSIRHGHPSTLHLWWARRPLAAARAVIFAQMVDDPSEYVDVLLSDPATKRAAQRALKKRAGRVTAGGVSPATGRAQAGMGEIPAGRAANGPSDPADRQALGDMAAELERERLFRLLEELVLWENTTNDEVLKRARDEVWQSWRRACAEHADHPRAAELFDRHTLPAFQDPFAGGGALPLEAQRLGLEAHASDLNPVAVLINKAMIEIPPKFAGRPPVNPESRNEPTVVARTWRGAQGLAEDVRHYGRWMRDEAKKRIGHLYPQVEITPAVVRERPDLKAYEGRKLTVIAWLWARTVKSPNPAFADVDVPLASTFMLSTKKGKGGRAGLEPVGSELARVEQQQDVERVVDLLLAPPAVAVVPVPDLVPVQAAELRREHGVEVDLRVAADGRVARIGLSAQHSVEGRVARGQYLAPSRRAVPLLGPESDSRITLHARTSTPHHHVARFPRCRLPRHRRRQHHRPHPGG